MSAALVWSHWSWPLATAIIGTLFTALLVRQYAARRGPHQLAWAIGFLLYAAAAFLESWSEYAGSWNHTVYRVYIVMAASLVGFLGLGVLFLVFRKPLWGRLFLVYLLAATVVFLAGAFTARLAEESLVAGITVGGRGLGPAGSFPRIMSLFLNLPGTAFLLGGALYSVIRFLPRKQYRYRVWANVLIIAGTLVIAAAGGRARAGQTAGLYPAEMAGAALLLWGFLKASTLEKGAGTPGAARTAAR
jgi:hypothetical protein